MRFRIWLSAAILICLAGFAGGKASAATPSGITLSPAFQQVTFKADEASKLIEFSVSNGTDTTQTIHISTADLDSLDDSGGLIFVGTSGDVFSHKYGLTKWLSLDNDSVSLAPHETQKISTSIINAADFTPGGHYGALMLNLGDSPAPSGNNSVGLHPVASALMFVNKVGGDMHRLSLDKVDASNNVFKLPNQATLHFRNTGNTHVIPRGTVKVLDSSGKLISEGVINENSAVIFPEKTRLFSVELKSLSLAKWPGKYRLQVDYRFDSYDNFSRYQRTLLLLTPIGLVMLVVLLSVITFVAYKVSRRRRSRTKSK